MLTIPRAYEVFADHGAWRPTAGGFPDAEKPRSKGLGSEDMRKLARYYDTLANRIETLGLSTPELVREAQAYRLIVRIAGNAATEVADALAAEDLEKALKAQNQFIAIAADEDKAVQRINALCALR